MTLTTPARQEMWSGQQQKVKVSLAVNRTMANVQDRLRHAPPPMPRGNSPFSDLVIDQDIAPPATDWWVSEFLTAYPHWVEA